MQHGPFPALESDAETIIPNGSGGGISAIPLKFGMSKNVLSERARRLHFNRLLYTLRSKVPKITKMDKQSTLSDAVNYVEELKREIKTVEDDIERLQQAGNSMDSLHIDSIGPAGKCSSGIDRHAGSGPRKLLEVTVGVVSPGTLEVRLMCERDDGVNKFGVSGVVYGAMKALESLSFCILNSNIVRHQQDSLCFWVVKEPENNNLNIEDTRQRILEALKWHGFCFS